LATQPTFQLQDQFGNPVAALGKLVVAALTSAGGRTLGGTLTVATDAAGVATFTNLAVSGPAGPVTLTFTQEALTAATSNAVALGAGAAAKLAVAQQPSATAASGAVLATQPIIQLQDQFGNPVAASGKLVVAALTSPGGLTLGGTLTVPTDAAGTATFTNLAASGPPGSTTLTFTQEALTAVMSNAIAFGVGAATKLVMTTPPSSTSKSGDVLAQQPVLLVSDAAGNTVTTSAASVTASASAGYTLAGAVTVSAGSGIVTFTNVAVTGPPGAALLTFASSGLTGETATVDITAAFGPPAHLFSTSLAAVAIDTIEAVIPPASVPQVVVKDAANNSIPGVAVKFTRHGSVGGLMNELDVADIIVTTGADGLASLTSRQVGGEISIDSVIATVAGLTDTVVFEVAVFNGQPHHMVFLSGALNALVGELFPVVVAVEDRFNNPAVFLTGAPPNITLSIQPETGDPHATLGPPPLTVAATAGIATFAVQIDRVGSQYQLLASSTGLPSITDAPFDIAIGPPATVVVWSGNYKGALKGGTLADSVVVQIQDAVGNNVTGVPVTFTPIGGGSVSFAPTPQQVTDASGKIGRLWTLGTSGVQGLNVVAGSASTTLTAFLAEKLVVVTPPTLLPRSGEEFPQQPQVQLQDLAGNNVWLMGLTVQASLLTYIREDAVLAPTLSGTLSIQTDPSGLASFAHLRLSGEVPNVDPPVGPPVGPQLVRLQFVTPADLTISLARSDDMTLIPGHATQLVFSTQPPPTASTGGSFSVVVTAKDAFGNVASDFAGNVSVAIGTNPSSGTLSGTLTVAAVAGVATFTGLSINNGGTGYTLVASSGILPNAPSNSFKVVVPLLLSSVSVASSGLYPHACGLDVTGAAYCWGSDASGGLGKDGPVGGDCSTLSSPAGCPTPIKVVGVGLPPLVSIAVADGSTCGLTAAGAAWCWGSGQGAYGSSAAPVLLPGSKVFSSIVADYVQGCGIESSTSYAYCWSSYSGFSLGIGTTGSVVTPTAMVGSHVFASLSAGQANTCGRSPTGVAFCTGDNGSGQLGVGSLTPTYALSPVLVSGGINFSSVSVGQEYVCGIGPLTAGEGTAYCWGRNVAANLGDGSATPRSAPTTVLTALKFAKISAGYQHTCALTAAGAAYCWGANFTGALGTGNYTDSSVPVAVAGGLAFASIKAGFQYTCGVTTANVAYCWGQNTYGQLGNGTPSGSNVPVIVVSPPPLP